MAADVSYVRGLIERLKKDKSASTFNRLLTSQHVPDLQLIALVTLVLAVIFSAPVVAGWFGAFGSSSAPWIAVLSLPAIWGTAGSILTWTYQTGSSRLGVVDLFSSEIATICRVITIVEVAPRCKDMYENPPERAPEFLSQEHYTPVFDDNSRALEVLEARVVEHVTCFYSYLKTMRDYLRVLSTIEKPRDHPEEWRSGMLNIIYMLFLALESARRSIRRLVEFEPEREENTIVILLSEVVVYAVLFEAFKARAAKIPEYSAKFERLRLRRNEYEACVVETAAQVRSHMTREDKDEWMRAFVLLEELDHRYKVAFGCLPRHIDVEPGAALCIPL
jgi:uncharacterized protein (DUF486 family)